MRTPATAVKQRKAPDPRRVQAIVEATATSLLGEAIGYSQLLEQRVGVHYWKLVEYLKRTVGANIELEADRQTDAEARAAFLCGFELGRRLGGGR